MCYNFNYDVRYFFDKDNIYFRKGIWNTVDGVIPFSTLDDKEEFIKFLLSLEQDNKNFQEKIINKLSENDKKIVYDLAKNKFIISENQNSSQILQVLIGQNIEYKNQKIEFQLVTDMDFITEQLNLLKETYNYTYSKLPIELMNEIKDLNYLSKVDSILYKKRIDKIRTYISLDKPVLILLKNISIPLLRNLNEALENTPLFIGFIDGPFMFFLSIIPKQTACWNCFEQRMLSFVKDNSLYERFSNLEFFDTDTNIYNLQFTHLLHMGMQEIFSWNLLKMSKFLGRCMFIYLPTMEIHFHNINKIPSCSNCGHLSQIDNYENNALLSELMDNYISNIRGDNDIQ